MNENEFMLEDRLIKIRQIITKYGEEKFFVSFSGGKDSTVLSWLIDRAIPSNNIPRVYCNTGIEYNDIVNFVSDMQKSDNRIIILKPKINIKSMLINEGYPFKSKQHSAVVNRYQRLGLCPSVKQYLGIREDKEKWSAFKTCPKKLEYQFTDDNNIKISDKCCQRMKKDVIHQYQKESKKTIAIIGIRQAEHGNRENAQCIALRGGKVTAFQPLTPLTDDFMNYLVDKYNIKLCKLYYPPYNFKRTGCKGCPFALGLQNELDIMSKYMPNERKQCEIIWSPVYTEYRRIGYRLKKIDNQLDIFDFMENDT